MINTPFPKLKLTVNKVEGECYHGYKKGDTLILEDFTHPPQYFCLGLAHAMFPVIYALSFGARFPFRDNQRSLLVTCPDGGKLEFLAEILDKDGKPEHNAKDPDWKWDLKGMKCPEGFCGAAFHTAFPALFASNFGAKFFFMKDDQDSVNTVTCPDGGNIVFRVGRKKSA